VVRRQVEADCREFIAGSGALAIERRTPSKVTLMEYSQLSFSQAAELVRDGAPTPRSRPIIHRLFSEALADRIDGPVCARSRHAFLGARTASFVGKPKRELQLHDRMRFEM
jgi:hypothetical protein